MIIDLETMRARRTIAAIHDAIYAIDTNLDELARLLPMLDTLIADDNDRYWARKLIVGYLKVREPAP